MCSLNPRLEFNVTEESCRKEIESFARYGQLVPVLGRALKSDPDHDVELIYGTRRLFVARHLNQPILVELRDMSDQAAIVAMDVENRHRADISPYERGLSYARWIRSGCFQSQDELARALKVSSSQVCRLLKLARLPSVLINAFKVPSEICEGWGLDLIEALDNPAMREPLLQKARLIASVSPRPDAREVYRQLLAAAVPGRKLKKKAHDDVIKDNRGAPLFRVRHQTSAVTLILPVAKLSARALERICSSTAAILQDRSTQPARFESKGAESKSAAAGPKADHSGHQMMESGG
jgi:ParB family chromosome partitioning protein